MPRPTKLTAEALSSFLAAHPEWKGDAAAIERTFVFEAYAPCVGFVTSVALTAEKRDHHPDIVLTWGKVNVRWSTHDAGGVTGLDVELASACDELYRP